MQACGRVRRVTTRIAHPENAATRGDKHRAPVTIVCCVRRALRTAPVSRAASSRPARYSSNDAIPSRPGHPQPKSAHMLVWTSRTPDRRTVRPLNGVDPHTPIPVWTLRCVVRDAREVLPSPFHDRSRASTFVPAGCGATAFYQGGSRAFTAPAPPHPSRQTLFGLADSLWVRACLLCPSPPRDDLEAELQARPCGERTYLAHRGPDRATPLSLL